MTIYEIMLPGIILVPVLGVVILLFWTNASKKQGAIIGITSEGFALLIPLILLRALERDQSVQFSLPWIPNMGIAFSIELNWLSLVFLLTEVLVTLAAMFYSLGDGDGKIRSNYYYALLLLFSLGMSGTTLADDIFLFYIFWELMLIASVLLILIWGHGENRQAIALKYFIITHIGSLLVLVCLITLYVNSGTASLNGLILQAPSLPVPLQTLLILMFLIGFCIKMAIFPLHLWLPDAHTVAPMPVTIILAAAMLSMGTYGILRYPLALFGIESFQPFAIWLMVAGLVSEIYGALMALVEKDIKRIIAYSSVSQMGYIIFGIGSLTDLGIIGGIMHVVYHAIVKGLLFMIVGIIYHATGERDINRLGGMAKPYLPLTVCAAIGVLSISGMPPFGIFNSEWMIFSGGFNSGYPVVLTILTVLGSIFTLAYALRFFGKTFLGPIKPDKKLKEIPPSLLISTFAVTLFLVIEGLLPDPLISWVIKSLAVFLGA